jgi:multidrug efflux system membrane fusion protein
MISGYFYSPEISLEKVQKEELVVRVMDQNSVPYNEKILIKGFAEADKKVDLKSETSGRVVSLPVEQGSFVEKGEIICSLFVAEKESFFKKAELEFKSAKKLFDEGLYSSNQLQNIKSNFERAKLELDNASIKAPFDGIVDRISIDEGDFLSRGSTCATLLDLDPMILVGEISESDLINISKGSKALIETLDGNTFNGEISFIAASANPYTHTFRVEVKVENTNSLIKDGASAKIYVSAKEQMANLIPLSILRLDDQGNLGVRLISNQGTVEFKEIGLIQDTNSGVWVSGLPSSSRIITVGQDYVNEGEKVKFAFDQRLNPNERAN